MIVYHVKDWQKHFENNRTREIKHPAWVLFPNKHHGAGFTTLICHPNGTSHYGAWCILV